MTNRPPVPKATVIDLQRPRMGMPPRRTAEDMIRDYNQTVRELSVCLIDRATLTPLPATCNAVRRSTSPLSGQTPDKS